MASGYDLTFQQHPLPSFSVRPPIRHLRAKYDFQRRFKGQAFAGVLGDRPDALVGKVLAGLLEVCQYNATRNDQTKDSSQYEQAAHIVARLTGKRPDLVASEQEFLHRQYQNISIKNLSIDPYLVPVLESRLAEAQHCLASAPLATIFLCGSILEGPT